MSDILYKAIILGRGLVKKVDEVLDTILNEGKKKAEGIPSREEIENRLVEGGVKLIKGGIEKVNMVWQRTEDILVDRLSILLERLDVATRERVDVVEKISLNTREMVEELKKKVEEIERRITEGKYA